MNRRDALRNLGLSVGGLLLADNTLGQTTRKAATNKPTNKPTVSKMKKEAVYFGSLPNESIMLVEKPLVMNVTNANAAKSSGINVTTVTSTKPLGIKNAITPNVPADTALEVATPKPSIIDFPVKKEVAFATVSNNINLYLTANENPIANNDIPNQFNAFQVDRIDGVSKAQITTQIIPEVQTTDALPDVLLSATMTAFHLAENEPVNKGTVGTLRITFSKEDGAGIPRAKEFDKVYWAIVTGLQFYDDVKNKRITKIESNKLATDFSQSFGHRPIEIPGGFGSLQFEVIKHQEPSWWHKILNFFSTPEGKLLASSLGFPGVTETVFNFVNQYFSQFDNGGESFLLRSRPLNFAFSKQAKDAVEAQSGGLEVVSSLKNGTWILAKGKDFQTLSSTPLRYNRNFGLLIPQNVTDVQVQNGNYEDPFKNITYAIVTANLKAGKLEKSLL